jgi:hypothetical protein
MNGGVLALAAAAAVVGMAVATPPPPSSSPAAESSSPAADAAHTPVVPRPDAASYTPVVPRPAAAYTPVVIRNDVPRVDVDGNILNAHDGSVKLFFGTWFMYGTVYEDCHQNSTQCESPCGYNPNTFAIYRSPDLMTWTLVTKNALPNATVDNHVVNYWMPVVNFNTRTGQYVMQYWSSRCGFQKPCADMAVSSSPEGPFSMVPPITLHGGIPSSQMGFFVDTDGTGYVKYNTGAPQHHVVEKLSDDWLSSTGEWSIIFWKPTFAWMEGGGMFKRGDRYHYMSGTDCCFCEWGGDARYWTSYLPLGPWHPGVAPPLPTSRCDLTGNWTALGGPGSPGNETFSIVQHPSSDNFTFTDANGSAEGWVDQATGYVTFPPSAGDGRGVVTSADGLDAGCDRVRWYGYESFIWCRAGSDCPLPSYADAPELNYCADGSLPHEDVRLNPCDPNQQYGTNFTVPAQQFNVISVPVVGADGENTTAILYYGERANSAPDGLFSHNFQAWVPLVFDENTGAIQRMTFPASFTLNLSMGA